MAPPICFPKKPNSISSISSILSPRPSTKKHGPTSKTPKPPSPSSDPVDVSVLRTLTPSDIANPLDKIKSQAWDDGEAFALGGMALRPPPRSGNEASAQDRDFKQTLRRNLQEVE